MFFLNKSPNDEYQNRNDNYNHRCIEKEIKIELTHFKRIDSVIIHYFIALIFVIHYYER